MLIVRGHPIEPGVGGVGGAWPGSVPPCRSPPGAGGRDHDRALLLGPGAVGGSGAHLLGDLDGRDARGRAVRRAGPRGAYVATTQRLEDRGDVLLVEGLALHQGEDEGVQHVAVEVEDVVRLLLGGADEQLDLLVDDPGHLLGVVALVTHVAAHERLRAGLAELDGAEPLAHAVLRDHRPGQRGRLLDVVAGTGGDVVEDQLLGRHPTHHVGELVEHLRARLGVLVLVGQHHRVAQRPAARQDRHLVHGVAARHRRGDQGVAALVVGREQLLLLVHQAGALLRPGDDAVDGLLERGVVDQLGVLARGQQGGLVEHVGQVGAGEARRTPRHGDAGRRRGPSACRGRAR